MKATQLTRLARRTPLPALITGATFGLLTGAALRAADVSLYMVKKGIIYTQSDPNSPIINSSNGYGFEARAYQTAHGLVTDAQFKAAAWLQYSNMTLSGSQNYYGYGNKKNTLSKLGAAYPDGTYLFSIHTLNDGFQQPSLALTGAAYQIGPHIRNFTALQNINPNAYFMINWERVGGAANPNFIRAQVNDAAGGQPVRTPDIENQGAFDGTASYLLVAPGLLTTDQTYTATVVLQNNVVMDRTSYPGALGVAGYYGQTDFPLTLVNAPAPDVRMVEVSKCSQWVQTNTGPATPQAGVPFLFNVSVQAYQPGILSTGVVLMPPGAGVGPTSLLLQPDQLTLGLSNSALTAAGLNSLYGQGTYTIKFGTAHDGSKTLTATLWSVTNAPPAPHLTGFPALQAVNAGQDLLVSWDPWTRGGWADFVQLRVNDQLGNKAYETPAMGKAGALTGTCSNAVIKAGTLTPGQSYEASLFFKRTVVVSVTNYPGVLLLGDYCARTQCALQTAPSDVLFYGISKSLLFTQTQNGPPIPLPANGCLFNALVQAVAPTSVLSAVTVPMAGGIRDLSQLSNGTNWCFSESFPCQAELDTAYPNPGGYFLILTCTNDGLKDLSLAFNNPGYPNAPQISNLESAQLINPTQGFTLSWIPFAGTSSNDHIQLMINDSAGNLVFKTPDCGKAGALAGSITNTVIPAGTLVSNHFYQATLAFQAVEAVDTISYPGALGLAVLSASTQLRIGTAGPDNPPRLSASRLLPSRLVQVTAHVVPGQAYRLEGAPNLPPVWSPILTNSSTSNTFFFIDGASMSRARLFYRLVVWP